MGLLCLSACTMSSNKVLARRVHLRLRVCHEAMRPFPSLARWGWRRFQPMGWLAEIGKRHTTWPPIRPRARATLEW